MSDLYWLASQDEEGFRALRQESCELVYQDMLNFICLLYSYANTDTVDTGLNEDLLVFIARNSQRIKENFGGAGGFNLWDVVPLGRLGSEVRDRESSGQGGSDALKIGSQRLRLWELVE